MKLLCVMVIVYLATLILLGVAHYILYRASVKLLYKVIEKLDEISETFREK